MSGPPYPHPNPAPGSNAIGEFTIGESPIGTIPAFDYWQTVISQYANAPILTTMITNFFEAVNQTADFDQFFDFIWNVDTAVGYGLDVWGRIVGVQRVLQIPGTIVYLDFEEQGGSGVFGVGTFWIGGSATQNFSLSDDAFRTLIFAKALFNICDGSIKAINALLLTLFPGRGNAYVKDNLDMTMSYNFVFSLSTVELAIVQNSGALPRPTGVSVTINQNVPI